MILIVISEKKQKDNIDKLTKDLIENDINNLPTYKITSEDVDSIISKIDELISYDSKQ